MKKSLKIAIMLLVVVFYATDLFAQQNDFSCAIEDSRSMYTGYSPFGEIFTPKGTLKVLVIYAGFENEGYQYIPDWPSSGASSTSCPNYVDKETGAMPDFLFGQESDFETVIQENPNNQSISRFYYDMSYGKFKFIGDVFKSPVDNKPIRINIDPTGANNWATCNKRVLQKIDELYPDFDWDLYLSQYDNRENCPNFQFDNTDIEIHPADKELDYVIIIWRWSPKWNNQPVAGITEWSGSGGGISSLRTDHKLGTYTIKTGYTHANSSGSYFNNLKIFTHEVAHELYSCPHVMGCNGCAGNKFHFQSGGWGMMATIVRYMVTANAWESWLCGWLELTSNGENTDIQSEADLNNDGIYTIGDFLSTEDVIRIKIPYTTDQYLWIENHQKLGVWEFDPWREKQPSTHGETIPDAEPGIYMYIESVQGDRNNISTQLVGDMNRVNGIKVLNPQGNYDYTHSVTATKSGDEYWNNYLFTYKREKENTISGINPFYKYPDNYPNNPEEPIFNDDFITLQNDYNKGTNEVYEIVKETNGIDTFLLFANTSGRNEQAINIFNRRSDAFQLNDEVSLSGIVPVLNYPNYKLNANPPASEPYLLNGLHIKLISYNENDHSFQVQIKFDDYEVRDNKRWTGNIHLNNISHDEQADVNLQSGNTIYIDKSGTPNRHTMTEVGDYINLTEFHCNTGAKFTQQPNSYVEVKNKSSLILHEGSTYEIMDGAELQIKNNSVFEMEPCSKLIVHGKGKIIFDSYSEMRISEDAILIFDNIVENLVYNTSKVHIPEGYINPFQNTPSTYTISEVTNWNNNNYSISKNIIIKENAILNLNNTNIKFAQNAKIIIKPGGRLIINGGLLTNSCGELWDGIIVLGNSELSQNNENNQGVLIMKNGATIENAKRAIYVGNPDNPNVNQNGGIIKINNAVFRDNIACIEIPKYHNYSIHNPNTIISNRSYVKNSTFETTGYFASSNKTPCTFISLWQVEGIVIENNNFKNTSPENSKQGRGIYAINAGFYCIENNFENLYMAIKANSPINNKLLKIDTCTFINNHVAIHMDAVNNFSITKNTIQLPSHLGSIGVFLMNNPKTFTFKENEIYGNYTWPSWGILSKNNVAYSNIYLNNIHDLGYGICTYLSPNLKIECNDFKYNKYDIYISFNGASKEQGTHKKPAGNKFIL